ncbi:pseudouridine synthase [Spiroplasma endosymbiont of 'Nebria riversi']|uniref:pseudouridine synthase n=1 Tax=Spiroplasma endosymbiont of 'Nebria riversi' TaxID=2792084 RepID=UPI001C0542D0|nr:pseudouridine synthase [Spiroplasma endosymbiont of 'Nebria riversi']
MKKERLQKIIAMRGYCSRRKAEQLILAGKVAVNEQIITELGFKVEVNTKITVNGQLLPAEQENIYLAFNKPIGCITSLDDPLGRKTVFDYLQDSTVRIYPIGRLDYYTSGLLLLTNDGNFANLIMHPTHGINKVYEVAVKGKITSTMINNLLNGVLIDDDFLAKAVQVKLLRVNSKQQTYMLAITIQDGHNQQIRKMIKAINGKVLALKRVAVGMLTLSGIGEGHYRLLTNNEVKQLEIMAKKNNP